ncbi:MAG TPA: endonuclease/exonuclease/phosphatase family protein [Salinisphaeraceae bacterium]|nr:endonuclease/exonuclease/phosphatase family protein [Salinisphaeraceae bacterium]
MSPRLGDNALSFMSFNMQVGIGTKRYREYITRGWRHLLPSQQVHDNLARIAELIADYDFVGLQELDAGSHRSGYINQLEWLAQEAGFAFWHTQVNRDLGQLAQHGLGLLARHKPFTVEEHKLPGRIPGRGALIARFGNPEHALTVVVTHLSLTAHSRNQQLAAICALVADDEHVVIMGDTNCSARQLATDSALAASNLQVYQLAQPTFPSWRPRRCIDHILVTPDIHVHEAHVLDVQLSDHLPVQMRVSLTPALRDAVSACAQA